MTINNNDREFIFDEILSFLVKYNDGINVIKITEIEEKINKTEFYNNMEKTLIIDSFKDYLNRVKNIINNDILSDYHKEVKSNIVYINSLLNFVNTDKIYYSMISSNYDNFINFDIINKNLNKLNSIDLVQFILL